MNARNKILRMSAICLLAGLLPLSTSTLAETRDAPAAQRAPDFTFTDMHGKQIRLSDFQGKWVLVNFWSPWCPLCRAEVPHLNHLDKSDDIAVVGIAMDYGLDNRHALQMAQSMTFANVLGGNRAEALNASNHVGLVHYFPTSFLYNPNGERIAQLHGQVNEAKIRQAMQSAGGAR